MSDCERPVILPRIAGASLPPPVIARAMFIGSNFSLIPVPFALSLSEIAPLMDEPTEPPDVILSVINDERDLPLILLATL